MSTTKSNLKIKQGATYRKKYVWSAGGVPVDMTGWKGRMQIRRETKSKTYITELTTENGGIRLTANGEIDLYISDEDTAMFVFEEAVYDLELVQPDGDVIRRLEGSVRLSDEVTR